MRLKQCRYCGKIFEGKGAQAYCSEACRIQRQREMHRKLNQMLRQERKINGNYVKGKPMPIEDLEIIEVNGEKHVKAAVYLRSKSKKFQICD